PALRDVPRRGGAGRVRDSGTCVGIRDAELALETVGIAEEHAQDRSEVGDEAVGGAAGDEAVTDRLERVERPGMQREMVDTTAPEHRRLVLRLRVALDLEHVQLGMWTDVDDG